MSDDKSHFRAKEPMVIPRYQYVTSRTVPKPTATSSTPVADATDTLDESLANGLCSSLVLARGGARDRVAMGRNRTARDSGQGSVRWTIGDARQRARRALPIKGVSSPSPRFLVTVRPPIPLSPPNTRRPPLLVTRQGRTWPGNFFNRPLSN